MERLGSNLKRKMMKARVAGYQEGKRFESQQMLRWQHGGPASLTAQRRRHHSAKRTIAGWPLISRHTSRHVCTSRGVMSTSLKASVCMKSFHRSAIVAPAAAASPANGARSAHINNAEITRFNSSI